MNNQNWSLAFKISKNVLDTTSRIKKSCNTLIAYFPDISQGLIAYDKYQGQSEETIKNRIFHSFEKKKDHKPWLWGEDITRYKVKWNGKEYINYCNKIANPRKPIFFKTNRILVREITNPSIYAGYTTEELYNDPSVIIILKGDVIHLFCILGILNSKFATFFHFNSAPKAIKGVFPKILVEDIKFFPLPCKLENHNVQKQFITIVEKILSLTQSVGYLQNQNRQVKVKEYEKKIDRLVYAIYGLTEDEIALVEGVAGKGEK